MTDLKSLFSEILPEDSILTEEGDLSTYGTDSTRDFSGKASIVLLPRTTEEVESIIKSCAQYKIAIIPSGGRTGLCGGATAINREVVLSLQRMNKILDLNTEERIVKVQAGVTTQQIKDYLADYELDFPVSLASQGSSQIGGNIATNAGGIHFIRYGYTRNWVLGVTAVTGNGEILNTGKALYKDNTGYDLRSLFVGSEGTLGVITEAILTVTSKPANLTRVLCSLEDLTSAITLLSKVRKQFPEVRAFEFFTDSAMQKVTTYQDLRNPFSESVPCYVVVELEGKPEDLSTNLEELFMPLIEEELILDVVIAQSSKQSDELMCLREYISETVSHNFIAHKNDISVPVSSIPKFVEQFEELMKKEAPQYENIVFGHLADGNLHLNWLKPEDEDVATFFKNSHRVDKLVLELVSSFHGSISAEHGIGLLKRDKLHLSRSDHEIQLMKNIKQVFDPHGILNPGKVLPK